MEGDLRRLLSDQRASLVLDSDTPLRPVIASTTSRARRDGSSELRLIQGHVLAKVPGDEPLIALGECRPVYADAALIASAVPEVVVEPPVREITIADSAAKRCLDVTVSATLLFILMPLLLAVGMLVLLDRRGPVLFRQRRCGLDGREFRICKFRTMVVCDDGDGVAQTRKGDNRITPLGAFLRRTSIDELPQLINVLAGDMSLVGPRPHAVAHDRAFAQAHPGYTARYRVRPGITGLAQVRGERGAIRSREQLARRVAADVEYIENWSIFADLRILVSSVGVVFRSDGY